MMIRVGAVGLIGLAGLAIAGLAVAVSPWWWILAAGLLVIAVIGTADLIQRRHSVLRNSMAPATTPDRLPKVHVGRPACTQPYEMSLLNEGASRGGFAHDTGEGGLSDYHLRQGGDLIWEIGTGYFGCRTEDGDFDGAEFQARAGKPNVRCVSLKLSQGAKPGIGGVLPGSKVTQEIAGVRHVPVGQTVTSPPYHRVFRTPRELVLFIVRMRELAGGSGKVATGADIVKRLIQGADYTNAARAMMFAVGCQLLAGPPEEWLDDWSTAKPDRFGT
jgi:hypothetical protein